MLSLLVGMSEMWWGLSSPVKKQSGLEDEPLSTPLVAILAGLEALACRRDPDWGEAGLGWETPSRLGDPRRPAQIGVRKRTLVLN